MNQFIKFVGTRLARLGGVIMIQSIVLLAYSLGLRFTLFNAYMLGYSFFSVYRILKTIYNTANKLIQTLQYAFLNKPFL